MRLGDLFTGDQEREIQFRVEVHDNQKNLELDRSKRIWLAKILDSYWVYQNESNRWEVKAADSSSQIALEKVCANRNLIQIALLKNRIIDLEALVFPSYFPTNEPFEIGFGDIIEEDLNKHFGSELKNTSKDGWLADQLILKNLNETNNKDAIILANSTVNKAFRIIGKKIVVDVKRNKEEKYEIHRIVRKPSKKSYQGLLESTISIKDISKTGKIRDNVVTKLNEIDRMTRYIETWSRYKEIQNKLRENEVKESGTVEVELLKTKRALEYEIQLHDVGHSFNLDSLEVGDYLNLSSSNKVASFESQRSFASAEVTNIHNGRIYIRLNQEIEAKTIFISQSLLGDSISGKRRQNALTRIEEHTTEMPSLPLVLEGIDLGQTIQRRKIKAITPKVRRSFGEYGPNLMQENALEVAINTPDIAIIQGPPGTGKTKVISAISQRLTEEFKKNGEDPKTNILLTAYQHDAVENMALRTEVLGLPTLKISNSHERTINTVENWLNSKIKEVQSQQSSLKPGDNEVLYAEIKSAYLSYLQTLDKEQAKYFLDQFRKEHLIDISEEAGDAILKVNSTSSDISNEYYDLLLEQFILLRTEKEGYTDDGKKILDRLIYTLEKYSHKIGNYIRDQIEELELISEKEMPSESDLNFLSEYRDKVLVLLRGKDIISNMRVPDAKVEKAFNTLLQQYSNRMIEEPSEFGVLDTFCQGLSHGGDVVKRDIINYSAVVASTVQQSQGRAMLDIRDNSFDTVIIDEAARANPLDILIPMVNARRRIVLVGDHRQLPHIVDSAVEKELIEDNSLKGDKEAHLRDSLFERFYTKLKDLEKKDGIRRVVTLNEQYRMHPVIGDFISRNFYEKFNEPKLLSGTQAENLVHGIDRYNDKVAVSLNIPFSKGGEKSNRSKSRIVEAKQCIREAKLIMDDDPDLSVGIISFYRGQVDALYKEATILGLTEKDNPKEIHEDYKVTSKGEERFRIGTVDAFQGKEFDVVILSLVRSNHLKGDGEKDARSKFGFLTSSSRLNVAMSRAKKLIVSVGDEAMYRSDSASEFVPGLYSFFTELIDSEYGISIQ